MTVCWFWPSSSENPLPLALWLSFSFLFSFCLSFSLSLSPAALFVVFFYFALPLSAPFTCLFLDWIVCSLLLSNASSQTHFLSCKNVYHSKVCCVLQRCGCIIYIRNWCIFPKCAERLNTMQHISYNYPFKCSQIQTAIYPFYMTSEQHIVTQSRLSPKEWDLFALFFIICA